MCFWGISTPVSRKIHVGIQPYPNIWAHAQEPLHPSTYIYTQEHNLRCSRWVVILISCVKPTHFTQYSTLAVLDSLCGQIDLHNKTFWKTQSKAVETFHAADRNETKLKCDKYDISVIIRHDWFWDVCKKNLFLNFVKLFSFAVCKLKLEARGGSLLEYSAVIVITLL